MPLLVRINGSPRRDSRTRTVIDAVGDMIVASMEIDDASVTLADEAPELLCGLTRSQISRRGESLLCLIESADLLIVGSPVYRASYTGILKHLFDLIDNDALRGRRAILVASGGTPLHGLMLEHQLRPLMGFFGIMTVPTTLYALEGDIADGRIVSPELSERIARASREAIGAVSSSLPAEIRLATAA